MSCIFCAQCEVIWRAYYEAFYSKFDAQEALAKAIGRHADSDSLGRLNFMSDSWTRRFEEAAKAAADHRGMHDPEQSGPPAQVVIFKVRYAQAAG